MWHKVTDPVGRRNKIRITLISVTFVRKGRKRMRVMKFTSADNLHLSALALLQRSDVLRAMPGRRKAHGGGI